MRSICGRDIGCTCIKGADFVRDRQNTLSKQSKSPDLQALDYEAQTLVSLLARKKFRCVFSFIAPSFMPQQLPAYA